MSQAIQPLAPEPATSLAQMHGTQEQQQPPGLPPIPLAVPAETVGPPRTSSPSMDMLRNFAMGQEAAGPISNTAARQQGLEDYKPEGYR